MTPTCLVLFFQQYSRSDGTRFFEPRVGVSYMSPEHVRAKDLDAVVICSCLEKFCDIRDPVP